MPALDVFSRIGFLKPRLPVVPPPLAHALKARQNDNSFVAIPSTYGALHSSPAPGIVVAITLGSVVGFLLLLALLYSCLGFGIPIVPLVTSTTSQASRSVVSFQTASRVRKKRPVRATETYEVRTRERIPIPVVDPDEPVIVEPRREPRRGPPPPRVVSDDFEDDEIVVEEEHERPRRKSRRSSRRPESGSRRRESGYYRDVDPDRFAGGDAPMREVRGSSRRRYSRD